MKKTLILAIAVSLLFAGIAFGAVLSSKHDMRLEDSTNAGSSTAVCEFCHHPHRGAATSPARTNKLLWNKNYTTTTYAPYSGTATLNGTPATLDTGTITTSDYATALCMSCHDGANASNGVIRAVRGASTAGTLAISYDRIASNLGGTLADDHPVNFTYTDNPSDDIPAPGTGVWSTYFLFGGTFQCATCHDVHNGSTEAVQFLRGSGKLTNSQICLDCHTAK